MHADVVIERIAKYLKLQNPMRLALDVGCGTGISTVALKEISARVVGVDTSAEMLAHAQREGSVEYIRAAAEALPFCDGTFKLATVSSAFHWFERERFLFEISRVLTRRGWLVVYNNAFQARMQENDAFHEAFRALYPKRYPTPIRDWRPVTREGVVEYGFDLLHEEKYTNDVTFTPGELVDYLSTQSNIIAAVEGGGERLDSVREWLTATFTPFFTGATATFEFGGLITFLRKRPLA